MNKYSKLLKQVYPDAEIRWCPFTMVFYGDHVINRGKYEANQPQGTQCLREHCALWVWDTYCEYPEQEEDDFYGDEGHCGLIQNYKRPKLNETLLD